MSKTVHTKSYVQSGRKSSYEAHNESIHKRFPPKVPWNPDWKRNVQNCKHWYEKPRTK